MKNPNPTQEYLHECFEYRDGELFWKGRPLRHFPDARVWRSWNTQNAGALAGTLMTSGARGRKVWQIRLDGRKYNRYRLVYAMHENGWPKQIDHRDRHSINDRIGNLRPATNGQNKANSGPHKTNSSGRKGVHWERARGMWRAQIQVRGKMRHLGRFDTAEEAGEVFDLAHLLVHGEYSHATSSVEQ